MSAPRTGGINLVGDVATVHEVWRGLFVFSHLVKYGQAMTSTRPAPDGSRVRQNGGVCRVGPLTSGGRTGRHQRTGRRRYADVTRSASARIENMLRRPFL